eukprot:TRINITY_DN25691_c0_g1_i1.p1 TRINITY_DN25691_c0_g1~~TRINITY_DN25691_c0_g1_i1.p1  ORF type:complete len:386 (+),score=54.73 TRINITY_DN25691_c0_g1_i1:75-1160(+)
MAALDWPLSHEEQKLQVFRTYDRELKAVTSLLEKDRDENSRLVKQTHGDPVDLKARTRPLRMSRASTTISGVTMENTDSDDSLAPSVEVANTRELTERLDQAVGNVTTDLDAVQPARVEATRHSVCLGSSAGALAFGALNSDGWRNGRHCRSDFPRAQSDAYTPRSYRSNTQPRVVSRRNSELAGSSQRQAVSCQLEVCKSEDSSCEADSEAPPSHYIGPVSRERRRRTSRSHSSTVDTLPNRPRGAKQEDNVCRSETSPGLLSNAVAAKVVAARSLGKSLPPATKNVGNPTPEDEMPQRGRIVRHEPKRLSTVWDVLGSNETPAEMPQENPAPLHVLAGVGGKKANLAPLMTIEDFLASV